MAYVSERRKKILEADTTTASPNSEVRTGYVSERRKRVLDSGTADIKPVQQQTPVQKYAEQATPKKPNYGLGNIDLNDRPTIKNPDGSISTVFSMSFTNDDGSAVLVPGVRKGLDRKMTADEALQWYQKTGEYLGKFKSEDEANKYAETLHEDQAAQYLPQTNADTRQNTPAYLSGSDFRDQLTQPEVPAKNKFSFKEVSRLWKDRNKDNVVNALDTAAAINDVAGAKMRATVFGDVNDEAGGKANATTGNKALDDAAKAAGMVESMFIPAGEGGLFANAVRKGAEGIVEKAAVKTGSKVLGNKVVQKVAVGAVESVPYTAHQIGTQKMDSKEALKTAALNTALGVAAEPLLMGASAFVKGIAKRMKAGKVLTKTEQAIVEKTPELKTYDQQLQDEITTPNPAQSEQIAEELRNAEPIKKSTADELWSKNNPIELAKPSPQQRELEALKRIRMTAKEGTTEYTALTERINKLEGKTQTISAPSDAERVNVIPAVETPPTASQKVNPVAVKMADRTPTNVGKPVVKSYQFENPEVKPYYQDYAKWILDNEYVPNEQLDRVTEIMTKIKADTGLQPAQIKDAMERIVKDAGHENVAAAKRAEIVIDDMLTNGFTTVTGEKVPANLDYIAMKSKIEGKEITPRSEQTLEELPVEGGNYAKPVERNVAESLKPDAELVIPSTEGQKKFVKEYTEQFLPDDEVGLNKIIAELEQQVKVEKDESKLLRINLQLFAAKEKLKTVTSKLYDNTIQKSNILTDAEKAQMPKESFEYEQKPEATTTAQAAERVNADIEKVKEDLLSKTTFNDVDTDSAMMIAERYRDEGRATGDYSKMNEWFATIRTKATETGRGSQAWAKWSRTPEDVVKQANDIVLDEFDNIKKTDPGKAKRVNDDFKAAKEGAKQASDEAAGQATKELLPEDMLAKKVGGILKQEIAKKINPLTDMVNELFRVAKESPLPETTEALKRDPYAILQQAITNKDRYADVWEKAKDIVEKKYGDDPGAMQVLSDYFDKGIIPTYSEKTLNSTVNAAMKELQLKMSDIVLKGEKTKAVDTITQFLIDKTLATGDEAKLLAEKINTRFYELFKERATAILKQKLKIGAGKSSPTMQNLTELINAGAFSNEDLLNVVKVKYGITTLSNEVTKKIIDMAEQYRAIEDKGFKNLLGRIDIAAKIDFELAKLRKPTIAQRVASFNYIQQLFNTLTQIRNVVGNEALYRSQRFTKYPASMIDWIKSKATGTERQITFAKGFNPWGNMKSYWGDFAKGSKAGWQGYDLIRAETDKLIGSSKKFNSILNPLKYMESMLGASLNGFDYAAYMRGTKNSLYEMAALKAKNSGQKVTKEFVQNFLDNIDTEILEMSESTGKYLTLRNENTISDLLFGMKNYGNKIGIGENVVKKGIKTKEYGLGNVIMNYPQATGALLQMSIDYSPIGFIKGMLEVSRPVLGKIGLVAKKEGSNYKAIVDTFSKAIVGTFGFTALGYRMYDLGLITGKSSDDMDYSNLERQMGRSEYAVNVDGVMRYITSGFNKAEAKVQEGDKFYTYSWLQPLAASVSLGANIAQIKAENQTTGEAAKGLLNTVITSAEGALNTLTDQSVMTGLTKFTKGYDTKKNLEEMGSGVVTGFTGTFANQLRKLNDNAQRSTDGQDAVARTINKIKNRIPGLSKDLPVVYGTNGEVKEMYQGGSNNVLNILFNPGFVSKYKSSPGIDLVLQLYKDSGGEKKQFPRTVNGKTISYEGKDVRLTAEEIGELQRIIGQETITMLNEKTNNAAFEKLSTEKQIENIVSAMDAIGTRARTKLKNQIGKAELKSRMK